MIYLSNISYYFIISPDYLDIMYYLIWLLLRVYVGVYSYTALTHSLSLSLS